MADERISIEEAAVEHLFEELVTQQRKKVLRLAREMVPGATHDDILNPHDFPQLAENPAFNFEDGILSGLVSAQIAVRARILRAARHD